MFGVMVRKISLQSSLDVSEAGQLSGEMVIDMYAMSPPVGINNSALN